MRAAWRTFRVALSSLTILPARLGPDGPSERELKASRYAYPFVGLLLGLILAAVSQTLAALHIAAALAGFVLLTAGVVTTGGLHLDGLADTFDGLFARGTRERRLEILRDPHVGSFGMTAIGLVLVGKYAALSAFGSPAARGLALVASAVVGRCLVVAAAGSAPYARPDGTGRILVEAAGQADALWATVAALAVGTVLGGLRGTAAALAALGVSWLATALARSRLGGVTGDILGAVVELSELCVLFVFATKW